MNFVFQACWGPHVDLGTMQFLVFCVSLIHIACAKPETSDTHSKQACYLPAAKLDFLHIPHVSPTFSSDEVSWGPSGQIEADFQYNSTTKTLKSLEVWKLQTRLLLEQKPWKKIPVSFFFQKIPWLGWGSWRFSPEIAHRSKLPRPLKQKIHPALPKLGSPCLKGLRHGIISMGREANQALKIYLSSCFDACCKLWGTKKDWLWNQLNFKNVQWTEKTCSHSFFACGKHLDKHAVMWHKSKILQHQNSPFTNLQKSLCGVGKLWIHSATTLSPSCEENPSSLPLMMFFVCHWACQKKPAHSTQQYRVICWTHFFQWRKKCQKFKIMRKLIQWDLRQGCPNLSHTVRITESWLGFILMLFHDDCADDEVIADDSGQWTVGWRWSTNLSLLAMRTWWQLGLSFIHDDFLLWQSVRNENCPA